jgi:putative DNA primase/helicase
MQPVLTLVPGPALRTNPVQRTARLGDSSGALAGRFVLLRLTRSFFDHEDHDLSERLRDELPSILLWSIEGWRRLRARGRFMQPASGAELIEDMENLSSPVGSFVRDRCVIGPGFKIEIRDLYAAWKDWCDAHGRKEPRCVGRMLIHIGGHAQGPRA